MKKIILALTIIAGFSSCTDEQNLMIAQPAASFQILTPQSGESVMLTPANPTNPGLALTWEKMSYESPTQVNYSVEVDKNGDNFDTPVVITSSTNTFATITVENLNGAALAAGLTPYTQGGLDIRIKSTVGTNGDLPAYSNVVTYLVTTYTTELPKLSVPGNQQGWNPATAEKVASSGYGHTDFEGYMWLDGGFKFTAPNAQGNFTWDTNWGDDGSFTGVLKPNASDNCNAAVAGYYKVTANTATLVYNTVQTTWSIIGNATAGGWTTDTPMTYNSTTKKWEVIATLSTQAAPNDGLKFRANNDWALNFGDTGADGSLDNGGTNIGTTAGTYKIELDLSHPRAYTYTLTAQ